MKRTLPFVIIVGVLLAAVFTARVWKRSGMETPRTVPREGNARASAVKPGAEPAHLLGSAEAPVMIEEFGDFECQSCGVVHPILKGLKEEFGPQLVIVFREFPLGSHPHSLAAAQAAEAAGLQGKFWELHDLIYENQKAWHEAPDAQPIFLEYATRLGLALDRFKQDLNSAAVNLRISLDRDRGHSIGVTGTPTIFLNGREVLLDSMTSDKLRALINAEINSAKK